MTPAPFEIRQGAWFEAARLLDAVRLDEVKGDAVWLVSDGSSASFHFGAEGMACEVSCGPTSCPPGAVPLSPRSVRAADVDPFAYVAFGVADGSAWVDVDDVTCAVELVGSPRRPSTPWVGDRVASAEVGADRLVRALRTVATAVVGADLSGDLPPIWFQVDGSGLIGLHVDWRSHGAGRITTRTPADVAGEPITCTLPAWVLLQALSSMHLSDDTRVRIDVVSWNGQVWSVVSIGGVRLALRSERTEQRDPIEELGRRLTACGERWDPVSADSLEVWHPSFPVRVERCADDPDVVRLSTVVTFGIESTHALLHEVNAINGGLARTKVWIDGHRVVATIDLVRGDGDEVTSAVVELRSQASALAPLIGPLGMEPSTR
jgi:hypothetical protein